MTTTPSPIAIGDRLADIELIAPDGTTSSLRTALGGTSAVVHFMRSSSCPVCLAHIAMMQRMKDAGELGDAVIVVVAPGAQPEAEDAAARVSRRAPGASTWSSPDGHAALGMARGALLQHSGTFVVDAASVVRAVTLSANPLQGFSPSATSAALAEIAQAPVRSRGAGSGSSSYTLKR
jgi:peroxiredoxin